MRPRKVLLKTSETGFIYWTQWLLAQVFSVAILWGLVWFDSGSFLVQYQGLLAFSCVSSIPAVLVFRPYQKSFGSLSGCFRISLSWGSVLCLCWLVIGLTETQPLFSVSVLESWAAVSLLGQFLLYIPLHHLARYYRQRLMCGAGVVVYGTGALAESVAGRLIRSEGANFLGVVQSSDDKGGCLYPVLGGVGELQLALNQYNVGRLYIALPLSDVQRIESLYVELLDSGIDIVWVPDIDSLFLLNHSVTELDGLAAISLNESPLTRYPLAAVMKSVLDRTIAFICLVVFSPVLFFVALGVKLTSKGPVIFKQKRHGWNGQIIEVWKFRSMRMHEDATVAQATRYDSRITPLGRFIRRTSIDELPQLVNVLQGTMSLVGPRPHALAHNDYYSDKIIAYMARHRIKPGITGLAQISGYRGETETIDKMEKRVEFDLDYINNWSLWLDVKILFKTPVSLFCKNIY